MPAGGAISFNTKQEYHRSTLKKAQRSAGIISADLCVPSYSHRLTGVITGLPSRSSRGERPPEYPSLW